MDVAARDAKNAKHRRAFALKSDAAKEKIRAQQRARYAARKTDVSAADVAGASREMSATNTASSTLTHSSKPSRSAKKANGSAHVNALFYPSNITCTDIRLTFLNDPQSTAYAPTLTPLLPEVDRCEYCGAYRFFHEPLSLCCSEGEISLVLPEMPVVLASLYDES